MRKAKIILSLPLTRDRNNEHATHTGMKKEKSTSMRKTVLLGLTAVIISCLYSPGMSLAQETGPLLMKQELGYTLGGGVAGSAVGVILWFTDPLNPNLSLRNSVKDGFIVGTALGAMFGFYMLNNALVIPQESIPTEDFDQLLGMEDPWNSHDAFSRNRKKPSSGWVLPIIQFRF